MSNLSFRARWVLPAAGPPLEGGIVNLAGERIIAVGQDATANTLDLGDVVLLPGLVNTHTHLEFSDCEKPLGRPRVPLPEWIRQVIGTRHRGDRDATAAIRTGLRESLRGGVTTIGEISTTSPSAYATFSGSNLSVFQEVIGFSAARVDSVQNDLEQRLAVSIENSNLQMGISPHAPYTVHPQLLRSLVNVASERNLPMAMHLAESREELELLRSGTGPFQQLLADRSMWDAEAIPRDSTPLDYLRTLSTAPRVLVIHGNYLSDEEIAFLAEHRERMSVVFCPRTHAYFGHEPYRLEKMLAAGVRVALGTDSRASNPDLSLLSEMRFIAKQFSALAPAMILQMGTTHGAHALGLSDSTGELVAGKLADLVAIPCPADVDPLEAILFGDAEPSYVFVRGKPVDFQAYSQTQGPLP